MTVNSPDVMQTRAPFWVELLDRHGAVTLRQRVQGNAITIGRGYSNDLVVDDPFVAADHLKIGYDDEGALWIDDLTGASASASDDAPARHRVGSEATFHIGHTALRVRTAAFTVPPAMTLAEHRAATAEPGYFTKALSCAAILIGFTLLQTWFAQTAEFKVATYLPATVMLPLVALGWAGAWALVTRIVSARTQFVRHVFIIFALSLAMFAVEMAANFLSYSFALPSVLQWQPLATWALVGVLFYAHIAVIVTRHRRLLAGIVGVMVGLAIAVHLSVKNENEKVQALRISVKLLPPFLLLKGSVTPDAFFRDVDALQRKLEEARKKEPSSSGGYFDDFD